MASAFTKIGITNWTLKYYVNDKFSSSFDGVIQVDLELYGCDHSLNIRKINIEKYSSDKIMEMNSYAFPEKHPAWPCLSRMS